MAHYLKITAIDSNRSGSESYYYLSGEKRAFIPRLNGSKHGKATTWYKNGQKFDEGNYVKGLKDSIWVHWYSNGIKAHEAIFKDKKTTYLKHWDEEGNRVYLPEEVDEKPLYCGIKNSKKAEETMKKFILRNLRYPEAARKQKIEGIVIIGFTIDEIGSTNDLVVLESVNEYLDDEAKRVIASFPKWVPAKAKGENVRTKFKLPIKFKLKTP